MGHGAVLVGVGVGVGLLCSLASDIMNDQHKFRELSRVAAAAT